MTELELLIMQIDLLDEVYHACNETQTVKNLIHKIQELTKKWEQLENDRHRVYIDRGIEYGSIYRKIDTSEWLIGMVTELN